MTEVRTRRPPPPFRRAEVVRVDRRSPRLVAVTLAAPGIDRLAPAEPAASVRLLVPAPGGAEPELPQWTGNEFLYADGTRPPIRTLTPRRGRPDPSQLDVEVVVHGDGPLSTWAERAAPGDVGAISGPGKGYEIDRSAAGYLLAGDETALPAIATIVETMPTTVPVSVLIEAGTGEARVELPHHPAISVEWLVRGAAEGPGDALVPAVAKADLPPGTKVWAAGEAAAVQRIRRLLFQERGLDRADASVRGYWKRGRAEA